MLIEFYLLYDATEVRCGNFVRRTMDIFSKLANLSQIGIDSSLGEIGKLNILPNRPPSLPTSLH